MGRFWTVPRDWPGETVFIVAGGPSVAGQETGRLEGRKVIAINSSWARVPFADFLFFGDSRWWHVNKARLTAFAGRIVTAAQMVSDPRVLTLRKVKPQPGRALSSSPDSVTMQMTSLQGAINLAVHLGAARIALLGADMQAAAGGRTHHHAPHPWPQKPDCWDKQMTQLRDVAAPLAALGIEIVNCSPVSRIDWWPTRPLEDLL